MMLPKLSLLLGLAVSANAAKSSRRYDPKVICDNDWSKSKNCWKIANQMTKDHMQTKSGGWPKGIYPIDPKSNEGKKDKDVDFRGCLDNGATVWEIRFLALAYYETNKMGDDYADSAARFKRAAERGIDFIFNARHKKGGWPQYWPLSEDGSYQDAITFNDKLHLNVLELMQDMVDEKEPFNDGYFKDYKRSKAEGALRKGLEIILKTQIEDKQRKGGHCPKRIGWCAQHDRITRKEVAARDYEKASYSGKEGVDLAKYLMGLNLNDKNLYNGDTVQKIIKAVLGTYVFVKRYVIEGCRVEKIKEDDKTVWKQMYKCDKDEEKDPDKCPNLWPRFVDVEERKPIFCERSCVERDDDKYEWNDVPQGFNNVCDERRIGYSWTNKIGEDFFKAYDKWIDDYGEDFDIETPDDSCVNRDSGPFKCSDKGTGVPDQTDEFCCFSCRD